MKFSKNIKINKLVWRSVVWFIQEFNINRCKCFVLFSLKHKCITICKPNIFLSETRDNEKIQSFEKGGNGWSSADQFCFKAKYNSTQACKSEITAFLYDLSWSASSITQPELVARERKLQRRVRVGLQRSTSGTAQTALCSHNNGRPLRWRLLSAEAYQGRFLSHCDPSEQIVFTGELRLNILGCKKTHLRLIWWEMVPGQCPELKKKSFFRKLRHCAFRPPFTWFS